jgi:hypothetical protein
MDRYGIIWALFMGQNCVSPNGTVWAYRGPMGNGIIPAKALNLSTC